MTQSHKPKKRRVIPGEGMLWRNDLVSDRRTRGRARRRAPKCDPPTKVISKQPQERESETKPLPDHLECKRIVEETQRKDEKHLSEEKSEEKSVEKVVEIKAKHSEIVKVDTKSHDHAVLTNVTILAEPKHEISSTAVKELQQQQKQQQQQHQKQEETRNKNPPKQKQQKVNRKKLRSNKIHPETKMKQFPRNPPTSRNLEKNVGSGEFPKQG